MKSLTRKIAMAAAVLATAGALGANAADEPQQAAPTAQATVPGSPQASKTAAARLARLEYFENQEALLDAPSYDPSEHPDAKPAPHSAHRPPSVWDDPLNTASLGN